MSLMTTQKKGSKSNINNSTHLSLSLSFTCGSLILNTSYEYDNTEKNVLNLTLTIVPICLSLSLSCGSLILNTSYEYDNTEKNVTLTVRIVPICPPLSLLYLWFTHFEHKLCPMSMTIQIFSSKFNINDSPHLSLSLSLSLSFTCGSLILNTSYVYDL